MRIGVIGSGHIGSTLARQFARAGHTLLLASRNPDDLRALGDEIGQNVGTATDAAAFGEAVVVATPYGAWPAMSRDLCDTLAGKVVLDAANPYPERDGAMANTALAAGSGATTAGFLPSAQVVKVFNTIFWKDLADKGGQGFGMALAADNSGAVKTTSALVRDAGFEPVLAGGIGEAWRFDPGQPAYGKTLTPDALRAALAQAKHSQGDQA